MTTGDALTQLAFEYIRNQNKVYSSPAEFLATVNKIKLEFADLIELSPSELNKVVGLSLEKN